MHRSLWEIAVVIDYQPQWKHQYSDEIKLTRGFSENVWYAAVIEYGASSVSPGLDLSQLIL